MQNILRTSFALLDSQARCFFFFFHQLESHFVCGLHRISQLKTESFFRIHHVGRRIYGAGTDVPHAFEIKEHPLYLRKRFNMNAYTLFLAEKMLAK